MNENQRPDYSPWQELDSRYNARRDASIRYSQLAWRLIVAKRVYVGSIIGYVVFDPTVAGVLLPVAVSLIPIVVFQHYLVTRAHRNARTADYYAHALDRLEDRWIGRGDLGQRYETPNHPFSHDLDIFGRGSLFQLLCTPRTAGGRDTLASWLQHPADVATIIARQAAVRELRGQLDLREELDAAGAGTRPVKMETVRAAALAEPVLSSTWSRIAIPPVAWMWAATFPLGLSRGGTWWTLFLVGLAAETIVYLVARKRILVLAQRGYEIGLSLIATSVFARTVRNVPWLSAMNRDLSVTICEPPSPMMKTTAAATGFLVQLPVAYFLAVQLVPLLELRLLRRVRRTPVFWDAVGQCEALCALAVYAFEHPEDCFPEFVAQGSCFAAEELGHPLIAESDSVRNDVRLDQELQLLMVSGSNMSGKSTFLRTVGVNAVLGSAGAPVRATALRMSPLVIGTAMRFRDSLEQNRSYFFSVLSRLRNVLDLLDESRPLLFLFDEILQGTNSHDRLRGAEAVINKLLAADAIGIVTTHDLELTRVADHLASSAANVHFTDKVVDGKLVFDYLMRPGVVQSSNAITLMRNMGLDV